MSNLDDLDPAVLRTLDRLREEYPPIIKTADVAEILGLSVQTIRKMAEAGHIQASQPPGTRGFRFYLESVLEVLADSLVSKRDVTT